MSAPSSPRTSTNSLSTIEKAETSSLATKFSKQTVNEDKETGEKSYSGIFSEEYIEGIKQTPFAHLAVELLEYILSYVDMHKNSKAAQVCKAFHESLEPRYSVASFFGPKKEYDSISALLKSRNQKLLRWMLCAYEKKDLVKLNLLIKEFFQESDPPYFLSWFENYDLVEKMPFLIREELSTKEKEELQQLIAECESPEEILDLFNTKGISSEEKEQLCKRIAECRSPEEIFNVVNTKGASPEEKEELRKQIAECKSPKEIVNFLIEHPLTELWKGNQFTFRMAAAWGYTDVVRLMLEKKVAIPFVSDNFAIKKACENGHVEVVRLLLDHPKVNPGAENNLPFIKACENGHVEVVKVLLPDLRVDPAAENNLPLIKACWKGHAEVVKVLLTDPLVDPARQDSYALIVASENGHAEVVALLLADKRADPTVYQSSALQRASQNGHIEVVKLLLEDKRADPNAEGGVAYWHPLHNQDRALASLFEKDGRIKWK